MCTMFCWPFLVPRQMVKLVVPVWYLPVLTYGHYEYRKRNKKWSNFKQFGGSVPFGTLPEQEDTGLGKKGGERLIGTPTYFFVGFFFSIIGNDETNVSDMSGTSI